MDVLQVLGSEVLSIHDRKPKWFKVPMPGGPKYRELKAKYDPQGRFPTLYEKCVLRH